MFVKCLNIWFNFFHNNFFIKIISYFSKTGKVNEYDMMKYYVNINKYYKKQ